MSNQIKERPILFSSPMVRAIQEGRKTVTRRALKVQPHIDASGNFCVGQYNYGQDLDGTPMTRHFVKSHCLYGQPGDRLWVRETFYAFGRWETRFSAKKGRDEWHFVDMTLDQGKAYQFEKPQGYEPPHRGGVTPTWWKRPSLFMPRAASRILLEITSVSVERLQTGEGETAHESRYVAEGIHRIHHGDGAYYFHPFKSEPGPGNWCDPFDAWRELWVSINGADSWNANPWVWVVEFERVMP